MNIQQTVLILFICSLTPAFPAEPWSLFGTTREGLVATLGKPISESRNEQGVVDVFQKDGWEFKLRFENDGAKRARVFKLDRTVLSDQEIRRFLPSIHPYAEWKMWTGTSRRARRFYGGKYPTYYCVVSEDARSLLLVCPLGKDTPPDLSDF